VQVVILENVTTIESKAGLGESDRQILERLFKSWGYTLHSGQYDAPKSQCPHARLRFYLVAILTSAEGDGPVPAWCNMFTECTAALQTAPMLPLSMFLLPPNHAALATAEAHFIEPAAEPLKPKKGKVTEHIYEVDHMELYSRAGIAYPPDDNAFKTHRLTFALLNLPRREAECILYHTLMRAPWDHEELVVDIHKTLG
jgi:site-specific DNA-cytosine methylase